MIIVNIVPDVGFEEQRQPELLLDQIHLNNHIINKCHIYYSLRDRYSKKKKIELQLYIINILLEYLTMLFFNKFKFTKILQEHIIYL